MPRRNDLAVRAEDSCGAMQLFTQIIPTEENFPFFREAPAHTPHPNPRPAKILTPCHHSMRSVSLLTGEPSGEQGPGTTLPGVAVVLTLSRVGVDKNRAKTDTYYCGYIRSCGNPTQLLDPEQSGNHLKSSTQARPNVDGQPSTRGDPNSLFLFPTLALPCSLLRDLLHPFYSQALGRGLGGWTERGIELENHLKVN